MKISLLNTVTGLKPLYDADYDEKRKLKIGEVYEADIRRPRNLAFHRKYFALINLAWEYQDERVTEHFRHDVGVFRKTVELAAGWCEPVWSIDRREWVEMPKSIAFDSMDADEFRNVYERVKDVLFSHFLRNVTVEEFERNLAEF